MSPIHSQESGIEEIRKKEKEMFERKSPRYSIGIASTVLNKLRAEDNDVYYENKIVNPFIRYHKNKFKPYLHKEEVTGKWKQINSLTYEGIELLCALQHDKGKIRKYTKKELKKILNDTKETYFIS